MQEITLSKDVAREVIRCILNTCSQLGAEQLSQTDIATRVGVGQSLVNQWLSPKRVNGVQVPGARKLPAWDDLCKLMELFGTTDRLPILEQIHRVARRGNPLPDGYIVGLMDQAVLLFALEPYARAFQVFHDRAVPGLLQTQLYAQALIYGGAPLRPDFDADRALAVRLTRSRIITRDVDPVHYTCYLDEAVLYRMIVRGQAFIDQLEHLITMSHLPNVALRIVPLDMADSGHPDTAAPSATTLTLAHFTDQWVMGYTENGLAAQFWEKPFQIEYCGRIMGQFDLLAMSAEESRQRIQRRISELEEIKDDH